MALGGRAGGRCGRLNGRTVYPAYALPLPCLPGGAFSFPAVYALTVYALTVINGGRWNGGGRTVGRSDGGTEKNLSPVLHVWNVLRILHTV